LLRRLHKALADDTLRRSMDAEDDYVEDIKNFQRQVEQRERALKEKDRKIQEKEHALQEKQRQLATRSLHVTGTPVSQIAAAFALSEAEVEVEATLRELP